VGSMLTLVLADNLLFLYLGWEGVGLCSYLLIGFWYKEADNVRAALKAFIVTRIGDAALAVGFFLIFYNLGTLSIQSAAGLASQKWLAGSLVANAAAALVLAGALGKSAQLPLQTWLPDAMAGPTPVSALIHASTMVTAGVYLIARTHTFFVLAPPVQNAVAIIGAVTLLMAGSSAIAQRDIKRVLAYSTMSQVGYMFLALGIGAWAASIFHFMVHAFFKALLFLGAGLVIKSLDNEHDIFRMGGIRQRLPFVFWTFLIGSASLAAVPFVTGGFYSKDLILFQAWINPLGGMSLFLAGLIGSFLTSVYIFRLFFIVFTGEAKRKIEPAKSRIAGISLAILAILSIIGGYVEVPPFLGNITFFTDFMKPALPEAAKVTKGTDAFFIVLMLSIAASLGGIYAAYALFVRNRAFTEKLVNTAPGNIIHRFSFSGWGFDHAYDVLIVRPLAYLAMKGRRDFFDLFFHSIEFLCRGIFRILRITQMGNLHWYAAAIAFGAIVFIGLVIFS
ncbi:MAG: NADH-quinone oxidoreductase subunit L, partial [Syntrophorhabdus sp.]